MWVADINQCNQREVRSEVEFLYYSAAALGMLDPCEVLGLPSEEATFQRVLQICDTCRSIGKAVIPYYI